MIITIVVGMIFFFLTFLYTSVSSTGPGIPLEEEDWEEIFFFLTGRTSDSGMSSSSSSYRRCLEDTAAPLPPWQKREPPEKLLVDVPEVPGTAAWASESCWKIYMINTLAKTCLYKYCWEKWNNYLYYFFLFFFFRMHMLHENQNNHRIIKNIF